MLRLPHPEVTELLDAIKQKVIRTEKAVVADLALSYTVFRYRGDTPDLVFYDETGTIYIPADLIEFDEQYAHLFALHEQVEIQHKLASRSHAYAHRRALHAEFLAAKQIFLDVNQLEAFSDFAPVARDDPELTATAELGLLLAGFSLIFLGFSIMMSGRESWKAVLCVLRGLCG